MEPPGAGGEDESLRLPLLTPRDCGDAEHNSGGGGAGGANGTLPARQGTTVKQTFFNMLNIYVGIGLLSMPYAIMQGGWVALALLAALVLLLALSGQLICQAFDLMPEGQRRTYPELGRAAAGALGQRVVLASCFLELFGSNVVLLMVTWQMLELLLPSEGLGPLHPKALSAAIATACLLPLLFTGMRRLSRLSMLGAAATAMVVGMVVALLALDPHRTAMPQQPPPTRHLASSGMIQSIGIFALSSSAHSTLPALRSAMLKPSRFPAALSLSFGVMLATYSALAAAGYWYWGDGASPLVTTDLTVNSYYTRHLPSLDRSLAVLVLVNCLTKYPGLNLILQDMILSVLPLSRDAAGAYRPPLCWWRRGLRVAIFAAASLLAYTAYEVLGSMLSLLGGLCALTCSLLLPLTFYSMLAWRQLGMPARAGLAALLALGVGLIVAVTATNLCHMMESCGARPQPQPTGSGNGGGGGGGSGLQPGMLLPGGMLGMPGL